MGTKRDGIEISQPRITKVPVRAELVEGQAQPEQDLRVTAQR
jgi:hypothetical protein